ncbi:MAG: hypothetical protein FWD17_10385, partial [Polyangiaceae bacterium]|nr:hypothetical protein [Polyangiaceae bacterium]
PRRSKLAARKPSVESLREMPETDFSKVVVRRNPYAADILAYGYTTPDGYKPPDPKAALRLFRRARRYVMTRKIATRRRAAIFARLRRRKTWPLGKTLPNFANDAQEVAFWEKYKPAWDPNGKEVPRGGLRFRPESTTAPAELPHTAAGAKKKRAVARKPWPMDKPLPRFANDEEKFAFWDQYELDWTTPDGEPVPFGGPMHLRNRGAKKTAPSELPRTAVTRKPWPVDKTLPRFANDEEEFAFWDEYEPEWTTPDGDTSIQTQAMRRPSAQVTLTLRKKVLARAKRAVRAGRARSVREWVEQAVEEKAKRDAKREAKRKAARELPGISINDDEEILRRAEAVIRNPEAGIPWEEVKRMALKHMAAQAAHPGAALTEDEAMALALEAQAAVRREIKKAAAKKAAKKAPKKAAKKP